MGLRGENWQRQTAPQPTSVPADATAATDANGPAYRVSVIIPAYNAQRDIAICLRAIQESRGVIPEIVLVDDGSTDHTVSIAAASGVSQILQMPHRSGPAAARNAGAVAATGEILYFVDADVVVHPDALRQGADYLRQGPWQAVFGSYDTSPSAPGLVSQYRNLLHHFVHQTSNSEAGTFWAGCGAVLRSVFLETGGFSTDFPFPSVEDIEYGMRLADGGYRILLAREIRASHSKPWTLYSTVFTDVFRRGIPWTRLLMASGPLPRDLNLRLSQRLSVAFTGLAGLAWLVLLPFFPPLSLLIPILFLTLFATDVCTTRHKWKSVLPLSAAIFTVTAAVLGMQYPLAAATLGAFLGVVVLLNQRVLRFFGRVRGVSFAICCFPLLLIYNLCCGVSFLAGGILHIRDRQRLRESLGADPFRLVPPAKLRPLSLPQESQQPLRSTGAQTSPAFSMSTPSENSVSGS